MKKENTEYSADILVVDDTHDNLRLLSKLLIEQGYYVRPVSDGRRAISAIQDQRPDLILLDIMMPGMDGYEVCQHLQQDKLTSNIPIIFISALNETFDKVKAFSIGGRDYISKPFQEDEVLARVKTHLELKRSQEALENNISELQRANDELENAKGELLLAATTDPLTNLYNRRKFIELMEVESARFNRNASPFSLILSDIDNFKMFNDNHGHACGDFVLVSVARKIQKMLRAQDSLARWGGEEFIILLPDTSLEDGYNVAEKIRAAIASTVIKYANKKLTITMTFGLSEITPTISLDALINEADKALYKGKAASKNCVLKASD
jgi:diguanylate cyclase (GGDEF)-like protein